MFFLAVGYGMLTSWLGYATGYLVGSDRGYRAGWRRGRHTGTVR